MSHDMGAPGAQHGSTGGTPGGRFRPRSGGHHLMGVLSWSVLALTLGIGVFYGWRTAANHQELTQRNLRELDRIGRAIEGRVAGFAAGMNGWYQAQASAAVEDSLLIGLIPALRGSPVPCSAQHPRVTFTDDGVRLCNPPAQGAGSSRWWSAEFSLDSLRQALQTELFDATFLADSGRVFLGRGPAGLRLNQIPRDTAQTSGDRISTVRVVTIAGREYRLFLQPLNVRTTAGAPVDSVAPLAAMQWSVGGLVSTPRFRAEGLALEPRHLIFLGLLVVLAMLALPFLRTALIGGRESIKVIDVYLLSLSLAISTGMLGIALADVHYFGPVSRSIDANLAAASGRLALSFQEEIGRALQEMKQWEPQPRSQLRRTRVFDTIRDSAEARGESLADRYLHFQMMFWACADGRQADKLTPRSTNTPAINVRERDYFRRIRENRGYVLDTPDRPRYYIESIRSRNTGEKIAMISAPFTWRDPEGARCPADTAGVAAMATRLASLDAPVLPPGVRFALLRADGLTLFHSAAERNLEENFITETGEDLQVRALLAGRDSGTVSVNYMGRYSRVHIRPAGDSLALALVLDESLLGTAHFESIFVSLAVFLGWLVVLLAGFVMVEVLLPGRLHWAWPDRQRPAKYRLLTGLLSGYVGLLVLQALFTIRYDLPVEPASFLVPLQALGTALLVQAAGWVERSVAWRDARIIGWAVLGGATVLQLLLHVRAPATGPAGGVLLAAQLLMVVFAAWRIVLLYRSTGRAEPPAGFETWYVLAIALTLGVSALMPAYLLHQESVRQHRDRLIHFEQTRLQEQLQLRDDRIRAMNRRLRLAPAFDTQMAADSLDVLAPPVLGARVQSDVATACGRTRSELVTAVFARVERRTPFVTTHAVEMRQLGSGLGRIPTESCGRGVLRHAGDMPDLIVPATGERFRMSALPPFGSVSVPRLLYLLALLAAGWSAVFALGRWLARRVFLLDLPDSEPAALSRHLPATVPADSRQPRDASVVAICTRSMDRVRFRHDNRAICYIDLLQYVAEPDQLDEALNAVPAERVAVLDHFDHRLEEPAWSDRLLVALENHIWLRGGNVVLLSSREPGALFPLPARANAERRLAAERWIRLLGQFVNLAVAELQAGAATQTRDEDAADEPPADGRGADEAAHQTAGVAVAAASVAQGMVEQTYARAATPAAPRRVTEPDFIAQLRALRRPFTSSLRHLPPLTWVRVHDAAAVTTQSPAALVLDSECSGYTRLEAIAAQVRRRADFPRLSPAAVIEHVREMAESYYHALWSILEEDERVIVAQLAYGVVINPGSKRAVRRLLARRLLIRDPELRLMNRSFRQFVREKVSPASMAEWEQDAPSSQWQKLRFPLMLGLITLVAFLFVTQRNAFNSAMAVVTAAGVGTTAILKLLSAVRLPARGGD